MFLQQRSFTNTLTKKNTGWLLGDSLSCTSSNYRSRRIQGVWFDYLHTFLLGVQPDLVASCLQILSMKKCVMWDGRLKEIRLNQLYARYRKWCKDKRVQDIAPKSILWKLKSPHKKQLYPSLSQKHCKGKVVVSVITRTKHTDARW